MKIVKERFAGRRAVVTGASAGIGRATALRLAAEGARVGLVARRREALEATANEIRAAGGEALVLIADSSVESEIASAMDKAASEWGGLDIIVSNAGIELLGQDDRVDRLETAIWEKLITTNLTASS
jgi:NADP-dependent 3-hydroxy acid dehydrogenase YdfG